MIVSAGLALPCVGQTLPSLTNTLDVPQIWWSALTTLFSGLLPMRDPPTRWA